MKGLVTAVGFTLLLACQLFANERSTLARITVYWHGEGSGEHAAWNGTRLGDEHCAERSDEEQGENARFHQGDI